MPIDDITAAHEIIELIVYGLFVYASEPGHIAFPECEHTANEKTGEDSKNNRYAVLPEQGLRHTASILSN
jgi:hypothetical protein